MHEVGLMHEALRIAMAHAERNGARTIHALNLRIGPLAGVDVEALRLAFQAVNPGTPAAGAVLQVEETSVHCWCSNCDCMFEPAASEHRCPRCEQLSIEIRQGQEFDLVAVEIS